MIVPIKKVGEAYKKVDKSRRKMEKANVKLA